jgi:hypothetical protein
MWSFETVFEKQLKHSLLQGLLWYSHSLYLSLISLVVDTDGQHCAQCLVRTKLVRLASGRHVCKIWEMRRIKCVPGKCACLRSYVNTPECFPVIVMTVSMLSPCRVTLVTH